MCRDLKMAYFNNILIIKEDAIFLADSHIKNGKGDLIDIFKKMLKKNEFPSQIFLLGDISNILVGNLTSSVESNNIMLSLLDSLSNKIEIIYFEGNHDFNLANVLPKVLKISRKNQPLIAQFKDKKVLLAHGDIFLNKKYEMYIKILTSSKSARILNFFDCLTKGRLYNFISKKVENKQIKYPQNANHIIKKRLESYRLYINSLNLEISMIIEGHFHIGKIVESESFIYVALGSFYHDNNVFSILDNKFKKIF